MTVHIVWMSLRPETPAHGYWDQAILDRLFAGLMWRPSGWPDFTHHEDIAEVPDGEGAIVVVPARHHVEHASGVTDAIARLPWVLLILCGDEEGVFPVDQVTHTNMRVWVQTPQPGRTYPPGTRWLPNGPAPDAYTMTPPNVPNDIPWSFSGQVTHPRRRECVSMLRGCGIDGTLVATAEFAAGLNHEDYYRLLSRTKIAPCPSGPVTSDTFRLWEALNAECVPIVDASPSHGGPGYWPMVLGVHPIPVVESWADAIPVMRDVLDKWPRKAVEVGAWSLWRDRELAYDLMEDLETLTGQVMRGGCRDEITVLVPTSPIPSHPSTVIINEVIDSIRKQLPNAEILIMCDGVREAQEDRRQEYTEYLYELIRLCRCEWSNVLPVVYEKHMHQAEMARRILDHVSTPMVLYVEHDCPIDGPINWEGLSNAIELRDAHVIRLHHESRIIPEHEHLMIGEARDVNGVVLAPTIQWSQRPHLASTRVYRQILFDHFTKGEQAMIEDRMHGVVQDAWNIFNYEGWNRFKLWIYHEVDPIHGIKRSWHLDGRGEDPKWVEG